jgi:hypothetical protein
LGFVKGFYPIALGDSSSVVSFLRLKPNTVNAMGRVDCDPHGLAGVRYFIDFVQVFLAESPFFQPRS